MPGTRRAFRFPELSKIYSDPKLPGIQDFVIPIECGNDFLSVSCID